MFGEAWELTVSRGPILYFADRQKPQIANVGVSQSVQTYTVGDQIPVAVTFDGPVKVTGNEKMSINGVDCLVQESKGTVSKTLTFLYTVQAADGQDLTLANLSNVEDVAGNKANTITYTQVVNDVMSGDIPHWAALTNVTTDAENGAYAPRVTTGTLTVTLHEDENVRSWLTQAGATDPQRQAGRGLRRVCLQHGAGHLYGRRRDHHPPVHCARRQLDGGQAGIFR